ncbi:MAG: carbohydrate ABC transporter permease, partial [Spirochaetota bacterium]
MKRKKKLKINEPPPGARIIINLFLLILAMSMIIPIWNTIVISFTTDLESYEHEFKLWPQHPSFQGYKTLMARARIWLPFINNVFITGLGTAGHVIVSSCAGFVLTRRSFPGK